MEQRTHVWILNFEHDLALASNNPHYIPPKVAVAMNEDMSPLPFWLDDNATVLTLQNANKLGEATKNVMAELGVKGTFRLKSNYEKKEDDVCMAWGWDAQVAQQANKLGLRANRDLDFIREWSHRSKTILFLQKFAESGLFPTDKLPRLATTQSQIEEWTSHEELILKVPLSGSGRGIWWAKSGYDFNVQRWSKRTLETQGCILCEPIWEKTGDFAMEFICTNGKAEFAGYSHFVADSAGVYRCNLLRKDEDIEQTLIGKIGSDKIVSIKSLWIELLNQTIATNYNGIVGIDMLTGTINGEEYLNPCVEINLRMTMGMAARIVYDRWISPYSKGEYRTIHFKSEGELAAHAESMRKTHPTKIENGKLTEGYVLLTAETPQTHYGIEIEVEKAK